MQPGETQTSSGLVTVTKMSASRSAAQSRSSTTSAAVMIRPPPEAIFLGFLAGSRRPNEAVSNGAAPAAPLLPSAIERVKGPAAGDAVVAEKS